VTRPTLPTPTGAGRPRIAEAEAWGAEYLVVKGDLVERSRPEEWEVADRLLAATVLPATAFVPGNHEVKSGRPMDAPSPLPESGVEIVDHVAHHDVPGVRIILVNCTVDGHGHGAVAAPDRRRGRRGRLYGRCPCSSPCTSIRSASSSPGSGRPASPAARVSQLPRRHRVEPTPARWSPRATPTATGPTGRVPVLHTEVASTKDFPGVWAGYTVHEGGIAQTVRRTLAPEAMGWTEYSRRAVLGIWGRWSMGSLSDRCLVVNW
jgi:hypothetical protein